MTRFMRMESRRAGRRERARMMATRAKLLQAELKHADTLSTAEIDRLERELARWMEDCNSSDRASLDWTLRFLGSAIATARRGYGISRSNTRFVDLRAPFLEYAEAVIARRFPGGAN